MGCRQVVRQQTLTLSFVGSNPPIPVKILTIIFRFNDMSVQIQFIKGISEQTLPVIKLTKSRNGKTGTATFLFIFPEIFQKSAFEDITNMYLVWENKEINTNEISVIFKKGKPFLLKAIFIFKNDQEWFNFLNFKNCYSKETGLFFTESQS